jgi:prepilin-type N-terminal cleavage/methylation domain-containing protein
MSFSQYSETKLPAGHVDPQASYGKSSAGFTLLEILVAMSILLVMMALLLSFISGVSSIWAYGERKVETFQSGRAILELIGRELSPALVSAQLQLVQRPTLPGITTPPIAVNSSSLFWVAPLKKTDKGNLCAVGYYLTRDASVTPARYQLMRFFVAPDDTSGLYRLFDTTNKPLKGSDAPWLSNAAMLPAFQLGGASARVSVVADGIIAFWIRSLDINGTAIPYLHQSSVAYSPLSAGKMEFNSAAYFLVARPSATPPNPGAPGSFLYTDRNSTLQAHQMPPFIELTLLTLDRNSLLRNPEIPDLPVINDPEDLPDEITDYNQSLINKNIKNAQIFRTIVPLINAK